MWSTSDVPAGPLWVFLLCLTATFFLFTSQWGNVGPLIAFRLAWPPDLLPDLPSDLNASRHCNFVAPAATFVEGSSNSETLHIAFMAVLSAKATQIRLVVMDILRRLNTSASPDIVVHIFTDDLGGSYPSVLPQCDGLSVNLIDIRRAAEVVDVPHFCSAFGLKPHEPACFYLTKPLWYRWVPAEVDALLVLDADVRILGDVRELLVTELAAQRAAGAPFGLAPEQLPEYASRLGVAGVNGGVQLHDIRALREFAPDFEAFVSNLGPESGIIDALGEVVARFGDQSLLTYLGTTELGKTGGTGGSPILRLLPCTWNVQLCLGFFNYDPSLISRFPWVHISSCKGKPRLVHGNCGTYDAYQLGQWDDRKLVAIVNRIKAVGLAAPPGDKFSGTGGPVLETLGQYGSGDASEDSDSE